MNDPEKKSPAAGVPYEGLLKNDPAMMEREAARWRESFAWVQASIRYRRRREIVIDTLYAIGFAISFLLMSLPFWP